MLKRAFCTLSISKNSFAKGSFGYDFSIIHFKSLSTTTRCFQEFTQSSVDTLDIDGSKHLPKQRSLPIITSRKLDFVSQYSQPKQAWLESLETVEENNIGLIDLHPDVFGAFPRIDLIHQNIQWQRLYKKISYETLQTRAEKRGGGRKPWPQKGMGRARHGSIRSPLWKGGGKAFGPRGPQSYFYMLSNNLRVGGLCSTLSIKFAQNNLHIVDSLEIPTDDPEYMEDLIDTRFWGFSVLFVDDTDIMPRNISLAVQDLPSFNLMPTYGLNVYSMLKHETLVLTLAAVEKLEEKLLYQLHRTERQAKFRLHQ
ncbi:39S ribosomal protein L4, mitochondrial [Patella vulgata]|uniref:39S ribosomal protein L4, mitochondrial n=1 Tax=Patella vulgata TaxID=6465 RepID=UPI0024A83D58|nr:39S ribosomal protein L4, mitochondrial [Patella vulgata]